MIQIRSEFCPKNHQCPVLRICPVNAISQKSLFNAPVIDKELCIDCGECTHACPVFQLNAAL